jgi:hypothetical protein
MATKRTPSVSRTEILRLRKELHRVRTIVERNAEALDAVRKDCADNLRRCGELQRDFDGLRNALTKL